VLHLFHPGVLMDPQFRSDHSAPVQMQVEEFEDRKLVRLDCLVALGG
jgi:hypothetical protein